MKKEAKVLVIEDEALFARLCREFLERKGLLVSIAVDGTEGLEKFEEEKPDLVILDILLPNISGYEVLEKIRNNPDSKLAKTPVIVLTNVSQEDEKERFENLGIDCYLVKTSISADNLLAEVKRSLRRVS